MQDTIISYLAQGLAPTAVADIVGCSVSYISQLTARPDIQERIEEIKANQKETEEEKKLEKKYKTLEERLIEKVESEMAFAEYKELLMLMQILHRRKGPIMPAAVTNHVTNNVAILQIPQAAAPELVINEQNEVIGLGNTSLAPMGANGVKALFLKLKQKESSDVTEL